MNRDPHKPPMRMAVLISGTGRTLKNMLDRIEAQQIHGKVVLVIASTPLARGLQFAEKAAIPIAILESRSFPSQRAFSEAVFSRCREEDVELVVMAGFLRRVTIPDDFANRVTNIHPALIPSFCGRGFYGRHIHEAVLQRGVKLSGCTVHFVDNEYDHGPVILQRTVPVLDGDTPETLSDRVFAAEREAYPEALSMITTGRVAIDGRKVRILATAAQ